jgi:hypothetical protein
VGLRRVGLRRELIPRERVDFVGPGASPENVRTLFEWVPGIFHDRGDSQLIVIVAPNSYPIAQVTFSLFLRLNRFV